MILKQALKYSLWSPTGLNTKAVAFFVYVNDLHKSSELDPIMFADGTKFFEHTDLRIFFFIVNENLNKIYEWFNTNKLSLNVDKPKQFYEPCETHYLPFFLHKLLINDNKVERVGSIKFLGVLLDEHLSWKEHIDAPKTKWLKVLVYCTELSHF